MSGTNITSQSVSTRCHGTPLSKSNSGRRNAAEIRAKESPARRRTSASINNSTSPLARCPKFQQPKGFPAQPEGSGNPSTRVTLGSRMLSAFTISAVPSVEPSSQIRISKSTPLQDSTDSITCRMLASSLRAGMRTETDGSRLNAAEGSLRRRLRFVVTKTAGSAAATQLKISHPGCIINFRDSG